METENVNAADSQHPRDSMQVTCCRLFRQQMAKRVERAVRSIYRPIQLKLRQLAKKSLGRSLFPFQFRSQIVQRRLTAIESDHLETTPSQFDDQSSTAAARFEQPFDGQSGVLSASRLDKVRFAFRLVGEQEIEILGKVVDIPVSRLITHGEGDRFVLERCFWFGAGAPGCARTERDEQSFSAIRDPR